MKTLPIALIASAIGLAFIFVSPAEAAKKQRRHSTAAAANAVAPGGTTAAFQGGVLAGPLYNGQDYIGDDPDPNIRAYLLKDMTRYRGGR